jgi:hypothetical protein
MIFLKTYDTVFAYYYSFETMHDVDEYDCNASKLRDIAHARDKYYFGVQ